MTPNVTASPAGPPVLEPGNTCWRIEAAERAAFLIDNDAYYSALLAALYAAKRSISILGWAFDPRTRLTPDGSEGPDDPDEIGRILVELCQAKPDLRVRILVWKSVLGISGGRDFRGHRAKRRFAGTPVIFYEAQDVPFGACHHQKAVIIDDKLAFCGGGDIVTNRWDTRAHLHLDPRRILPDLARYPARHEVMTMVEGSIAGALGELFRQRWQNATGEDIASSGPSSARLWPVEVRAQLTAVNVAVARTEPGWKQRPLVDEIRRLTLACIASAEHTIYLENQYFTCSAVAEALATRLSEPDGPEVILIVSGRAPSWFDRMTMDHARNPLVHRLRNADRHGRFRALSPLTSNGAGIIVHAKVSMFDDHIVRVGSANLNNRSEGFDTECDLAIECEDPVSRQAIVDFRDNLLSHYLAVTPAIFAFARTAAGGLVAAIDQLNVRGRLAPVATEEVDWWDSLASKLQLGDPGDVSESWGRTRTRD